MCVLKDAVASSLIDLQSRSGKSIEEFLESVLPVLELIAKGEPIFILRAQDTVSVNTVLFWVREAIRAGAPVEKVAGACLIARDMKWWQNTHREEVKVPD